MDTLPEGLRKLLGRSEESIYVLDARGGLAWASPAMLRLLAADDVGELGARTFDDLWPRPAQRRDFLRRLAEDDEVEDFRRQLRGLDGEVVEVSESRYARRAGGGRLVGHVGILRSVPVGDEEPGDVPSALTRDFATGAYGRECLQELDADLGDRRCGCLLVDVEAARGELRPRDVRTVSHLIMGSTRAEDLLVSLRPDRLALITLSSTLPGLKAVAERIAARVHRETGVRVTMRLALRQRAEPVDELLERCRERPYARIESSQPRRQSVAATASVRS